MELYNLLVSLPLLFLCIHGLLYFRSLLLPYNTKLPPGPKGLPIVGSLLQLGHRPHESLAQLAKTHGPLMTLRLGRITTVVASSAEAAKEILVSDAIAAHSIPDAITAQPNYNGSIAWTSTPSRWKTLRKICNLQIFTTHRLDALQDLRHQKMAELVRHVREICVDGKAVNVGWLAFATMLNMISNTLFSLDTVDFKSEASQEFKDLVWRIMECGGKPNISDYFPLFKPFDPQGIRRHIRVSYDRIHAVFDEIIDRRLKSRETGSDRANDFLDVLLDHNQEHGNEFNREDIKPLFTDLFIAGSDTSAATTEWAMTELLRNASIMKKVKKELAETIGTGKTIEESDTSRLPYLQAVVKETLRLHPVVPLLLPHKATHNVQVFGFTIPKDAQVFVNAWAIGRDAETWESPTCFQPDRFLNSEVDYRGRDFSYIPFGAGRRICPGVPLAVRMVHLMLASLLHSFDWELPNGMGAEEIDMGDKFGVTLQKAVPLLAIPVSETRI